MAKVLVLVLEPNLKPHMCCWESAGFSRFANCRITRRGKKYNVCMKATVEILQAVQTVSRVIFKKSGVHKKSSSKSCVSDDWCHIASSCATDIWRITLLHEYHDSKLLYNSCQNTYWWILTFPKIVRSSPAFLQEVH